MATFEFIVHTPRVMIPDDPTSQFGGGYTHASRDPNPKQREFILSFDAMVSYVNSNGTRNVSAVETADYKPYLNYYRLMDFYAEHGTWKTFDYVYLPEGTLQMKFKGALEQPKVRPGGYGILEAFELRMIQQL